MTVDLIRLYPKIGLAKGDGRSNRGKPGRLWTIVFDGDDTLWDTQALYEAAKGEFIAFASQRNIRDPAIRERIDLVDARRVDILGFSPTRFPSTLVEVLRSYEAESQIGVSETDAKHVEAIGNSVFLRRARLVPLARNTLNRLREDYRLVLLTKGDLPTQTKRIAHSGLGNQFHAIYVAAKKDTATLRELFRRERINPSTTIVVGDSLRSDIRPALDIGVARAIWIPRGTWLYETASKVRSHRLLKVRRLSRIRDILK